MTTYQITVKGTSTNDKTISKTFSNVQSTVTLTLATQFANAYLALTTLTPSSVVRSTSETADLS